MVKPDIKHNYYADLDLPASASIEDIRKAYRKLALQYHPDRNSGREDEVVPKFQAIQAASEILCDPGVKEKYDSDRRKSGLYSSFAPRTATPGNPYAATSAYPPPPRRTQPGTWQRPAPATGPPPAATANGADRFTNFPRAPTARKDPAQERTNVFRAWQNMNTADRQQRANYYPQPHPPPPPPPPPQPQASKPRPPPQQAPPRMDARVPSDDQARSGAKYKVPPPFDADGVDKRSSAWASFHQNNAGQPGMPRSSAYKTPNKQGFNPNAPGSDERPAPGNDRHYVHSHSTEDYDRSRPDAKGQQPPRGEPSFHTTPASPTLPKNQRPSADPSRPFSSRGADDQVPFSEGTRERTPYSKSFYGDQSDFLREGLRRSRSTHNATKLSPQDAKARARSSSPHRPHPEHSHHSASFDLHSSSEESGADMTNEPEEMEGSTSQASPPSNAESPSDRPKKVPTGPSRRFANGIRSGHQSDTEQRQPNPNMYAHPSSSSSPSVGSQDWVSQAFGSYSTSRAHQRRTPSKIPRWAIPSSLNPALRREKPGREAFVTAADELFINATEDEQAAYMSFQTELRNFYGHVPGNLDMEIFFKLVAIACRQEPSGNDDLDRIMQHVLLEFPTVGFVPETLANERFVANRFAYRHNPELYKSNEAKSRSEEHINTTFSPDGWKGQFTGEPDYFASSNGAGRKQPSPTRRATPNKTSNPQQRSATLDVPTPGGTKTTYEEVPQRAWGSDGTPNELPRSAHTDAGFNQDEWQKRFQDSTWTFPPPPPGPPSPVKGGRKQSQSRRSGKPNGGKTTGSKAQPHVIDDDDTVEVEGADGRPENGARVADGDAMDIDHTPPSQQRSARPDAPSNPENGARAYSVPPSEWRQQHEEKHRSHRKSSSASKRSQRAAASQASAKFNANLDDLRNVEPLAQKSNSGGTINVADLSSALPFESQASGTMYGDPLLPRDLEIPGLPKPPPEPQRLSKISWQAHAVAFGAYVKEFHRYNESMLQHFQAREQQAQAQVSMGTNWLEATGDTSGMLTAPTGFGTYMRGVKEDKKVREAWILAWEKHADAVTSFEKVRDRVRKLVIGGMLVEN